VISIELDENGRIKLFAIFFPSNLYAQLFSSSGQIFTLLPEAGN
jgi:hypothetical protein